MYSRDECDEGAVDSAEGIYVWQGMEDHVGMARYYQMHA